MRKIDFKIQHDEFEDWLVWYGDFIKKLIEARNVVKTKFEKLEILEALVSRCAVRWEVLIEEDIITSLNRDSSAYAKAVALALCVSMNPRLKTRRQARVMVRHWVFRLLFIFIISFRT